jgi:hypothetical protein
VKDCCETATFIPNRELKSFSQHHHWREGNLPANSKCYYCKKTCWTSECLAGMKCEWCGITVNVFMLPPKIKIFSNFINFFNHLFKRFTVIAVSS